MAIRAPTPIQGEAPPVLLLLLLLSLLLLWLSGSAGAGAGLVWEVVGLGLVVVVEGGASVGPRGAAGMSGLPSTRERSRETTLGMFFLFFFLVLTGVELPVGLQGRDD